MKPLQPVEIGETGVEVTPLGLGGAPLAGGSHAGDRYSTTRETALNVVNAAWEAGVRYFDTAPQYGSGRSESRYGGVLPDLPRGSFTLSSKVGRLLTPIDAGDTSLTEDGIPDLESHFDMSRDGILRSVESSLDRLNLDHLDIIYLHDPDRYEGDGMSVALDSALPAMIELREQGVVGAIGCGMNMWEWPATFVGRSDLDVVLLAGRFTLLDHDAYAEFLPLCVKRGVSVVVGGPYNSGILARNLDGPVSFNYQPAARDLIDRARSLKRICEDHSVDLKAAALQYVLAHPAVISAVPGARSVDEIADNVAMVSVAIPEAVWDEMKSERLIPEDAPTPALA
jgi:D-threo-aldose 1-dehydrogenase